MSILYNPMQVQNALQNPVRFPDPRLQQYAAGQPPNPQVPPGPFGLAGLELTSRGAQRQAAANNARLQSDPSKSPTVFQDKDEKLQQEYNKLAQARQAMQQAGGLMAELLRKQAQDRQLRDGQGIATLSLPEDMFTAMHGGIVFARGGNVNTGSYTPVPKPSLLGPYTPVPKLLSDEVDVNDKKLSVEKDPLDLSIDKIRSRMQELEEAEKTARFSPEEKQRRIKEAEIKDKELYDKYLSGRDARIAETRAAIEGQAPTFQSRLGRGLTSLVGGDMRNLRAYEALARLGAGASEADRDYANRQREAAKYEADAKERLALANLEEERGRTKRANELVTIAESDLAKAFELRQGVLSKGIAAEKDIATLRQKEELIEEQAKRAESDRKSREKIAEAKHEVLLAKVQAEIAKSGAGGKTDLQTRARVAFDVLKEENDKLPPNQRKSEAQLRNEGYGLAEIAILGSRRISAAASMLRADVFNANSQTEALTRLRMTPLYMEASPAEQRELEEAVRARYPDSAVPSNKSSSSNSATPSNKPSPSPPPPPPPLGFNVDKRYK